MSHPDVHMDDIVEADYHLHRSVIHNIAKLDCGGMMITPQVVLNVLYIFDVALHDVR